MKPKDILHQLETGPKKRFGQNFLTDESALLAMIEAAELTSDDTVVEIGSGLGALTERLIATAKRVIAIEADRELADYLRERNLPKLTVVTADALRLDWTITIDGDYKIIANIPYSITSPLIRKIFSLAHKPTRTVLLVQKEVAERLCAQPGNSNRGFLTLLVEAQGKVKIVRQVKPGSFYPAPRVDSAIIELEVVANRSETVFWPAIEAAFSHKRQTLANGIANNLHLPKQAVIDSIESLGLNPMIRPSELTFEQWQELGGKIKELLG